MTGGAVIDVSRLPSDVGVLRLTIGVELRLGKSPTSLSSSAFTVFDASMVTLAPLLLSAALFLVGDVVIRFPIIRIFQHFIVVFVVVKMPRVGIIVSLVILVWRVVQGLDGALVSAIEMLAGYGGPWSSGFMIVGTVMTPVS